LQGLIIQYIVVPLARRPRPFGVVFHTGWDAWAVPSEKMAALVVTLLGILYGLVPAGPLRPALAGVHPVVVPISRRVVTIAPPVASAAA
jgi:hypothetical protein